MYGSSGAGKSSFAAQFPKCGFIIDSQEKGILFLSQRDLVPKPVWVKTVDVDDHRTWPVLLEHVRDAVMDNSIETLVLESVTGIENICFLHHCEEKFDGNMTKDGFFAYQQGPKNAARFEWPHLISAMDMVYESGKNVIITAHTQVKEETDPQGTSIQKYMPYCEKDVWARLHRWASGVFFLGKKIQEDKSNKSLKKIAASFSRTAWVNGTPFCDAKNWYGIQQGGFELGDTPNEGYVNFCKVMGY